MLIFSTFIFSLIIITSFIIIIFQILKSKKLLDNIAPTQKEDKTNKKEKIDTKAKLLEISKEKREIVEKLLSGLESEKREKEFFERILKNLAEKYNIVQGIVFFKDNKSEKYIKTASYAFYDEEVREFTEGVGISGQVAVNRELLNISNLPDKYITIMSGLGKSSPNHLIVFPILYKKKSIGVIEIATFTKIDKLNEEILMNFTEILGDLTESFR